MRKKAIKNLLTLVLTFSALLPLLPSPGSAPCPLCTAALSDQDWYLFDRFSGALLPLYLLLGQPGTGWFDQTNHLMQERLENSTALARFPAGAVPPAYCDRHRPGPGPARFQLLQAGAPENRLVDLTWFRPTRLVWEGQRLTLTLSYAREPLPCYTVELVPG